MVKIINNKSDAGKLVLNDQYIVLPALKETPELLFENINKIQELEDYCMALFNTNIVKDAEYFAKKYKAVDIKKVAKDLGIKVNGKEIDVAINILKLIDAETLYNLLENGK